MTNEQEIDFLITIAKRYGYEVDRENVTVMMAGYYDAIIRIRDMGRMLADAFAELNESMSLNYLAIDADLWAAQQRVMEMERRFKARCIQAREPQYPPHGFRRGKHSIRQRPRDKLYSGNRKRNPGEISVI